ncbi:MAG: alanine racemase [Planctomycetota bacterium]|nr:alanine racemase [Planctomycetota bacterium]
MQQRRVWAEIDLDAMTANLRRIRFLAGNKRVMAIVKANAYGHGAVPIAWHLASLGVAALGVGDSQEAIELRRAGISIPILVLGAVVPGELPAVVAHDIAVTVHSSERVRLLGREARRAARPTSVHLKIDTGMGRLGCAPGRAVDIARLITRAEFLSFDGLCTHFSAAGPGQEEFTARQIAIFEEVSHAIEHAGIELPPRHAANTAALLTRAADHLDVVRPGLALYGIAPDPGLRDGLTPALTLKSQIIFLKDHAAGSPIGYERTHVTSRRTRIATLPVGYHDGYAFRLGGKAEVLVRGQRAPVVGRVSMDYLTVDVGHVAGARVGDEVTLLGPGLDARELADRAGTIPYEVFTRLGNRVERVYHGGRSGPERGFSVVSRPGVVRQTPTRR